MSLENANSKITVDNTDGTIKFKLTRKQEVFCETALEYFGYDDFTTMISNKLVELKENNDFLECENLRLLIEYSYLYIENRK